MSKPVRKRIVKAAPKAPFPFWPFLLLLTLALFWLLPRRWGDRPVEVEFAQGER